MPTINIAQPPAQSPSDDVESTLVHEMQTFGSKTCRAVCPHLASWQRTGLPSANDQDYSARGILRHDMGRMMPHSALAAPLATTSALDVRQGG